MIRKEFFKAGSLNEAGEHVDMYGFEDFESGIFITRPELSECGRFQVYPKTYYNMNHEELAMLKNLNTQLAAGVKHG